MCQVQSDREILAKGPMRPYREFAEFCTRRTCGAGRLKPGVSFYPCLACGGRGWGYDPHDPPDPVEGNKHRETLECSACNGSGENSRKACLAAYRNVINEWREDVALFKGQVQHRRNALAKLKPEEIAAINNLGL